MSRTEVGTEGKQCKGQKNRKRLCVIFMHLLVVLKSDRPKLLFSSSSFRFHLNHEIHYLTNKVLINLALKSCAQFKFCFRLWIKDYTEIHSVEDLFEYAT